MLRPSTLVLHAHSERVADLPRPLEILRGLGVRSGVFLRLVRGPSATDAGWSYLALTQGLPLWVGRIPRGARLADLLEGQRPLRVRGRGPHPPFRGGWVGYLGYEARSAVEDTPPPRTPPLGFPSLWLGAVRAVLAWEPGSERACVASLGPTAALARQAAAWLVRRARRAAAEGPPGPAPGRGRRPVAHETPAAYQRAVARVRRHVRDGDLFQANLSQRFSARVPDDRVALFERLVEHQPAPYLTYLALPGRRAILSASPERFLAVQRRRVVTEPMKGTRPRGATPAADRAQRAALAASEKDRAELAMIVDLSRNDLARVCAPGTVRVVAARRLVPFAGVHQAVGVVEGRLAPGRDRVDLLAAAFPPGSVTGAPKVRALEVIDALEGEGRGPYCGALGWLDAGGDMDLCVAIRTLLVSGTRATYRVGGGITLRSDPRAERLETLVKGRGLAAALEGPARP